jgi:TonB family protein
MVLLALMLALQNGPAPSPCAQAVGTISTATAEVCQGEEAIRLADAAAKGTPERTRHLEEAVRRYRRGVDLANDPDLKERALTALADLFDAPRLNRPDALEGVLRELIALNPHRLAPQFRLAKLQEDQGLIDTAEDTLVAARRQQPASEEPYKMLAQFYARRVTALHQLAQAQIPPKANDQPGERDADGVYRVGGGIDSPKRLDVPQYPPEAMAVAIQGAVGVEVVINEGGQITDAKVVRSIPLLDEAALTAVREWRFKPTLMNGRPVPVRTTVMVNFTLPK